MSYSTLNSKLTRNRGWSGGQPGEEGGAACGESAASRQMLFETFEREAFESAGNGYCIIVHSQFPWDGLWKRPQQLMSRLSRRHRVLFVETLPPDPTLVSPLARSRRLVSHPNITLLRLRFPTWRWADGAYVDAERQRLIREYMSSPAAVELRNPVQWFYDPRAFRAVAGQFDRALTVYDCVDWSREREAEGDLAEREAELLGRADVVFTGGRALQRLKSRGHGNCHCCRCGVDWEHFVGAREARTALPEELRVLPRPVLGYFGSVDRRIDYRLLGRLAAANPQWSVVMIGPVAPPAEAALPRLPNLRWLGERPYADLPAFCKGFDACILPFAVNETTRFLNPAKTLEYLASGRAVVATAVPDVVRDYTSIVKIGRSPTEFIRLCEAMIDKPDQRAIGRGLEFARQCTWDSVVAQVEKHIAAARSQGQSDREGIQVRH